MSDILSSDLNELNNSINKLSINVGTILDKDGNPFSSNYYGTKRGLNITNADGPGLDSYGRQRISSAETIFGIYFSNTNHPLYLSSLIVGSATNSYNSTKGTMDLTVTGSAIDSIKVQSRKRIKYTPGISTQSFMTGIVGAAVANVTKRLGFYDVSDGVYIEQNGTVDVAVVMRVSNTGSVVNLPRITQPNWNLDKLDGSGGVENRSGVTLNFTKHNAFVFDYVWQGAGRVRIGILYQGSVLYFHEFATNADTNPLPYWKTPQLCASAHIFNTGASAGATMNLVCMTIVKESTGPLIPPYSFGASRGRSSISVGATLIPLISISPKTIFNSNATRVPIIPVSANVLNNTGNILVQGILNPTLSASSFNSADANSAVNFDIAATGMSGGQVLYTSEVANGQSPNLNLSIIEDLATLGLDLSGNADIFTIAVQNLGAGNLTTFGSVTWNEYQ